MITKVYLAGASSELARAKMWAEKLRDADIMLTSTWVDVIGRVGAANPANATIEQLTAWTLRDLAEVAEADNLWLLLPAVGVHTVGAYIELGAAYVGGKHIVMSGAHRPIFTPVLAHEHYDADEDAFKYITERNKRLAASHVDDHLLVHRAKQRQLK